MERESRDRWVVSNDDRPVFTKVYACRDHAAGEDPWGIVWCPVTGHSIAYAYTYRDEASCWRELLGDLKDAAMRSARLYDERLAEWRGITTQHAETTVLSRPVPMRLAADIGIDR